LKSKNHPENPLFYGKIKKKSKKNQFFLDFCILSGIVLVLTLKNKQALPGGRAKSKKNQKKINFSLTRVKHAL
jgi:hypothetical protein